MNSAQQHKRGVEFRHRNRPPPHNVSNEPYEADKKKKFLKSNHNISGNIAKTRFYQREHLRLFFCLETLIKIAMLLRGGFFHFLFRILISLSKTGVPMFFYHFLASRSDRSDSRD